MDTDSLLESDDVNVRKYLDEQGPVPVSNDLAVDDDILDVLSDYGVFEDSVSVRFSKDKATLTVDNSGIDNEVFDINRLNEDLQNLSFGNLEATISRSGNILIEHKEII